MSDQTAQHVPSAPRWLLKQEGITQREWKAKKRAELKAVAKAWDVFRRGCAFTPATSQSVDTVNREMKFMTGRLSSKEWGK